MELRCENVVLYQFCIIYCQDDKNLCLILTSPLSEECQRSVTGTTALDLNASGTAVSCMPHRTPEVRKDTIKRDRWMRWRFRRVLF